MRDKIAEPSFSSGVNSLTLDRHEYCLEYPLCDCRLAQAFELRAQVFCSELGWVGRRGQLKEVDAFDGSAWHLGVLAQGQLAAYLRVHPYWAPWMIDSVFSDTVPTGCSLRGPGKCEVSRLAIAPGYRRFAFSDGQTPTSLILQLLYTFCVLKQINKVYMVVTDRSLRALRLQGLPCHSGPLPHRKADRDAPVFATLNWDEFRSSSNPLIAKRRPAFLAMVGHAKFSYQGKLEASRYRCQSDL
ncbi:acyl-homoserine-lactone synthase [Billgrantia kenyensis]|uniref:Acyl-homoserine-lactone synthase n=1 Tax=Billgrantia kenyensis TaxID=321266 RepID=A0A7V9W3C8_9GAMM|nr:GNAT family N-acetyltransferase [Halomonas kenyensis]MCG6663231.1 GNAT family N-acetyltransferase [Halomonas kenyensis]